MLLRRRVHPFRKHMSWKIDGRHGAAKVGESRREGFALMHDRARRLIAFQAVPDEAYLPAGSEPSELREILIDEVDFEPNAA